MAARVGCDICLCIPHLVDDSPSLWVIRAVEPIANDRRGASPSERIVNGTRRHCSYGVTRRECYQLRLNPAQETPGQVGPILLIQNLSQKSRDKPTSMSRMRRCVPFRSVPAAG